MYRYKVEVMKAMKEKGFPRTRLRGEKIFTEATMQALLHGENVTLETLNKVCVILRCQLSDIIEIEPTDEEKIMYY